MTPSTPYNEGKFAKLRVGGDRLVSRTILPGGLRVVTEYVPHVRSVSIGFWLRAGSRYEADGQHGISHFIEHMLFKGTRTRSARDLAEAMDSAGGQMNAFTARELTCYYARVPDQRAELAVDLLADMLVNPLLDEGDIEKEKGVVVEEIRMCEDTPEDLVHEMFSERVFGQHPLARSILGTEDSVGALDRRAMVDYMARHYTAGNLVVAAAGRVEHDDVVRWVYERLAGLGQASCPVTERPLTRAPSTEVWREKDIEQVHLCIGGPGLSRSDDRRFAAHILDMALGGGMSSRLFQELREERGLVYSVYSFHTAFAGAGLFGVYAATSPEHVQEVVDCITGELEAVLRDGLRPDELERAKEQLKGGLLLSMENTSTRMSRLAKGELFEEPVLDPDELVERIDRVSADDVAEVAHALLGRRPWTMTAVGPRVPVSFDGLDLGLDGEKGEGGCAGAGKAAAANVNMAG